MGVVASALVACGGGSSAHPDAETPDSPTIHDAASPDAAVGCVATTFGPQDILSSDPSNGYMAWGGTLATNLGDGGSAPYAFEFFDDAMTNLVAPIDLSTGGQNSYKTCVECITLYSQDATGAVKHTYFQSGGTLTLTDNPFTAKKMAGTITNLAMVEVTIDPTTFATALVPGGKCLAFGNVTLNHTNVPNAWTCAAAAYDDGATCDCMCGVADPDCNISAMPANGCTSAQVCSNAVCVAPAPNDTCQLAQVLTIGTPKTGNTAGATSNYNLGLETTACTGHAQPGADVAYSVVLAAATAYTFKLTNVAPQFDPSISLVGPGLPAVCDASPVACLKGADMGARGQGEMFSFTPTTAGTYYVIVDSKASPGGAPAGAFTLTVTSP